ncbi:MAG: hypothetical protein ACLU4N_12860 [Butyricimonas faecihominis]
MAELSTVYEVSERENATLAPREASEEEQIARRKVIMQEYEVNYFAADGWLRWYLEPVSYWKRYLNMDADEIYSV